MFPQDIWVIGDKPIKARFYIVNYESIEKLSQCLPFLLSSKNTGIIVDECHNFRNVKAQRVVRLQAMAKILKCQDILLMSGTPIKAMGVEMIPTLDLIDPYFDDVARNTFVRTFGLNMETALDILKNRLGLMMYRQTKSEVLHLPDKKHIEIKIKIPQGSRYELETVKTTVLNFIRDRHDYYKKTKKDYEEQYNRCISYIENNTNIGKTEEFILQINDNIDCFRSSYDKNVSIEINGILEKIFNEGYYEKD